MAESALMERAREIARDVRPRLVFPEMDDPRIAEAARRLGSEGLVEPVPLAEPSERHIEAVVRVRGVRESVASRMVGKQLVRAAAMVAAGEADAMIAGAAAPTRRVIEAAGLAIGLAEGVSQPSSFFVMVLPDGREMLFSDCAVTVEPDADGLAAIARASAVSAKALFGQAELTYLSYSTGTSGAGASVDRVRAAAAVTGHAGPLQADAALNAAIAASKGAEARNYNAFVFPSLDAGNIAYKLLQELAGAQALGPFLQGFAKPVCDLSRGASVEDIVGASLITSLMSR